MEETKSDKNEGSKQDITPWLLLGAGFFLFYLLWIWNFDLWQLEEARVGQGIRSMMEEGIYVLPHMEGEPIVETPPLYLWLGALFAFLFQSTSAVILRLPSVLSGGALVILVGWTTARYMDKRTGLLAGIITGTCCYIAWQASRVCIYVPGTLFIFASLYLFYSGIRGRRSGKPGPKSWIGGFLFASLALLTVGLPGLLPPIAATVYILYSKRSWMSVHVLIGFPILLALPALWCLLAVNLYGGSPTMELISYQTVDMITGTAGDTESVFFYPGVLLLLFLPWTPHGITSLLSLIGGGQKEEDTSFINYNVTFFLIFLVGISLLATRREMFLLPALPPLAVLTADDLKHRVFQATRNLWPFVVSSLILALLLIGIAVWTGMNGASLLEEEVYMRPIPVSPVLTAGLMAGISALGGLAIGISSLVSRYSLTFASIAGWSILLVLVVKAAVLPTLNPQENVRAEVPREGIQNMILTWEETDMVHTMTINYQTRLHHAETYIHFDTTSRDGNPDSYQKKKRARKNSLPRLKRTVHSATLTGLKPDTQYYFVAGSEEAGYSRERTFKTLPSGDGDTPVRFLVGGDQGTTEEFKRLNEAAAGKDPHFAVIGGDIAYANGFPGATNIWNAWFRIWESGLEKNLGRMVPAIFAMGNHELPGTVENRAEKSKEDISPFFFHYFNQGEQSGYFTKQLGQLLQIIVLDSGYISSIKEQTPWLKEQLQQRDTFRWSTAVYHRPLYPLTKPYDSRRSRHQRELWRPLFEQFQIDVAFEKDDHVLKRTYFLRDNRRVAEGGIPYLGGGAWGIETREPREDQWFTRKASGDYHFWYGEMTRDQLKLQAIGLDGQVLDELILEPKNRSSD